MSEPVWDRRYFATTRGQLLQRLRGQPATVDELAQALDLTDNAIRAQLALLERDGLVCEAGRRRTLGSRKPSQEYRLTQDAERLFPKPYDHVLRHVLAVLGERLGRGGAETAVREVGVRLAQEIGSPPAPTDDRRVRLRAAAEALSALGGVAEVVEDERGLSIQGRSCPLAAAVTDHGEVCQLTASFISTVSGVSVCDHCERGPEPRCRFDVAVS